MDETRFQEAQEAYDHKDYRAAAKGFIAAAEGGPEGNGTALHMAGNSLMKLGRHADAVTVYKHAIQDESYAKRGAVYANLGRAYVALEKYSEAVEAYESAVAEPAYEARYKALQGMAGALFELRRVEEAGTAYRKAALDPDNPDPGKALNNLGVCFMSLERAEDAVEAYKAALDVPDYSGKGRAAANLGVAYATLGMHARALSAFARAENEFGHRLTGTSAEACQACREALGGARQREGARRREVVDGWSTGEQAPIGSEEQPIQTGVPGRTSDSHFFTVTEHEMRVLDRDARKAERRERRKSKNLAVTIGLWATLVLALVAGGSVAWFSGFGFPTQTMTVKGLLEAHSEGRPVEDYWVAVPTVDAEADMGSLPPRYKSYTIEDIERSARTSKVDVVIVLDTDAPLRYEVSMLREGVGWKVSGITNDWTVTGSGS